MNIHRNKSNSDKLLPHPILDDPTKMMRIIANPLYDKLTISRAAQMRKYNPTEYIGRLVRLKRQKEKTIRTSIKSLDSEETIAMPLLPNNNQLPSKSASKQQNSLSIRNIKPSVHSRNRLLQSSILENDKKPGITSTIRYINSHHGLEVQRYSSHNCLSIDLLSKDASQSQEKAFREMLDKQEQNEVLSQDIYTLEYYRKRYNDLLQSYKQGNLTHDQWAKQNYQLYCLKTFYTQAVKREQYYLNLHAQKLRQRRAENVFNQWKEAKNEGNPGRHRNCLDIVNSQHTTERTSGGSKRLASLPNNTTNSRSISSTVDNELEELTVLQPINSVKNQTITSNALYMFDDQRSSFPAMLKRVVGLAEPLPPLPKIITRKHSSVTNLSNDSGFESGV